MSLVLALDSVTVIRHPIRTLCMPPHMTRPQESCFPTLCIYILGMPYTVWILYTGPPSTYFNFKGYSFTRRLHGSKLPLGCTLA